MKSLSLGLLVAGTMVVAVPAHAGWVVEWTNVVRGPNGPLPPEPSTMQIQGNRVRLTQPKSVTLIDYNKDLFTIINPVAQTFWSGTVDQYVGETTKRRDDDIATRSGRPKGKKTPAKVDEARLPPITVQKSDQTKTIAGHTVTKYEILSAGEPFQEMWLAEDVNVSSDLDPDEFLAYQLKMSNGMIGNSAKNYQALYRNEDYKKIVSKGFALDVSVKHSNGGFDRTATAIRREDIPATTFQVPDSYRRVALVDVLPKPDLTEQKEKPQLPPNAVHQPKGQPGTTN